jgi:hypothetical protein
MLLFFPTARLLGSALGAMVLIVAIATLVRHREWGHPPPGLALAALSGVELALNGAATA